ncbi:IPP transferase-domain-containing protein [Protomyces lactucae-debilis]|uniref:tRNA dimethylallyltransferase n=1 Tax=Protomyces lactucae-debilis TaxID=2754530 RepID=A0A1Y2FS31_PROLT|nr:IPP transferase-domain-containing protein [Protomyces lactucae-debilis]ORY85515.1 IPP transferase-domain-containing protein [Protomyces lactucae-debilis]
MAVAAAAVAPSRKPLVVQVIGTTGVGKSQLAVDLARKLNGECINSDAIQVYKGLDIITNKATLAEQRGVKHHLLGFLDAGKEYRIAAYDRDASLIIDQLQADGKLPIVVGGTAYYASSLLFKELLPSSQELQTDASSSEEREGGHEDPRLYKTTAELHADLSRIDPIMAERWHPNDRRKIRRALELFYSTGTRQSELYAKQRERGRIGPEHVAHRTLIFWLWSDQKVLDKRLDARIDAMIQNGLFDEIREMHALCTAGLTAPANAQDGMDFTRGIFQAIGYKEFLAFLQSGTEADKEQGIQLMKTATRRYARKQVKWIKNKLLLQCAQAGPEVEIVLLNATNLEAWEENVAQVALQAVDAFEAGDGFDAKSFVPVELRSMLRPAKEKEMSSDPTQWQSRRCETCPGFVAVGTEQWQTHLTSAMHRGRVHRQAKHKAFEAWKRKQETEGAEI